MTQKLGLPEKHLRNSRSTSARPTHRPTFPLYVALSPHPLTPASKPMSQSHHHSHVNKYPHHHHHESNLAKPRYRPTFPLCRTGAHTPTDPAKCADHHHHPIIGNSLSFDLHIILISSSCSHNIIHILHPRHISLVSSLP